MGVAPEKLNSSGRILGRYALYDQIAAGGMATVHLGRLLGPSGFSRTVAIKKLQPQYAKDADFVAMFMDEARLAARVRHPNVVPTIDIVSDQGEIFLVMDYVQGDSLSQLIKKSMTKRQLPPQPIVAWIMAGALHGLHAAHEATNERGEPLQLIHRDVSPQNILVGLDGAPRILDFGVAKAVERTQTTKAGQVKGKIAYMSPEQLTSDQIDRRTDIYAAGVVLWEALTGLRLFQDANQVRVINLILSSSIRPPSELVPNLPEAFDAIVLKALAPHPDQRYQTAREMAIDIESWRRRPWSVRGSSRSRASSCARVPIELRRSKVDPTSLSPSRQRPERGCALRSNPRSEHRIRRIRSLRRAQRRARSLPRSWTLTRPHSPNVTGGRSPR
jgi:serine/threonine-protein kinase